MPDERSKVSIEQGREIEKWIARETRMPARKRVAANKPAAVRKPARRVASRAASRPAADKRAAVSEAETTVKPLDCKQQIGVSLRAHLISLIGARK